MDANYCVEAALHYDRYIYNGCVTLLPMTKLDKHNFAIHKISNQIKLYSQSPYKRPIKFFHGGTNSTRNPVENDTSYFIDISDLNNILEINIREKYVVLEPNVAMDDLVKNTLLHNLIPPVVPEFPGITIGGAINGASLESSSFKFGQVNDSCVEYEVILGNGDIITINPK